MEKLTETTANIMKRGPFISLRMRCPIRCVRLHRTRRCPSRETGLRQKEKV